jgi:hypothetical protein
MEETKVKGWKRLETNGKKVKVDGRLMDSKDS